MPGPCADIERRKRSRRFKRLPKGVGGIGDSAYAGIGELHPEGLGASPRRKPRGKERPPEDRESDRAFRRRRIAIGRRRSQAMTQVNRHGRAGPAARVRAVAGLVNRMLDA